MASLELQAYVNDVGRYLKNQNNKVDAHAIDALYQASLVALNTENDIKFGLQCTNKCKKMLNQLCMQVVGKNVWQTELECFKQGLVTQEIELFYEILLQEAPLFLDSYCLYIEKKRKPEERFYLPRRKTLKQVVDCLQMLEDDELDELFLHQPPRTGKTGIMTMGTAWHCARNTELSNLYCSYKEDAGGTFLDGVKEMWTDPTYCHRVVFPRSRIVDSDAKANTVDLERKKKYKTLSAKGLTSGLNGLYDANGWLIADDVLEGIQDVLSPETLHRKQIIFDNNLMSRKKEKCKVIYNGTIWSLHDIFMKRLDFLENNPEGQHIRYKVLKIPALNENDESNFDYAYNVGYSTKSYLAIRAKFEENDDMAGWYAQYQQEPIERDGAVFSPDHMKFYNGVLPKEEPVRICGACDVALGGQDYLSFPIAYIYENGDVYIDDVVFDNSEKNVTQPQVLDAIIAHNLGSAFFEANQGGEGYKDDIERLLKERGVKINITSKYAPSNKRKEQRIWDKAPEIRDWYFRDTGCRTQQYRKFMQNLYSFTINGKNRNDDAPDSLATLASFISGTWSMASVEVIKNPFRM